MTGVSKKTATATATTTPATATTTRTAAATPEITGASPMTSVIDETLTLGEMLWQYPDDLSTTISEYDVILRDGVMLGLVRHRAEKYKTDNVVQCYKCRKYGHFSTECKSATETCNHCSGGHKSSDCEARETEPTCANCAGAHPASHKSCDAFRQAKIVAGRKELSYAQAVKGPSNITESLRLAMTLTELAVSLLIDRLGMNLSRGEVCHLVAQSVNKSFKVGIDGDLITHLLK